MAGLVVEVEGGLVYAIPRLFLFFIRKSTTFSAFCRSIVLKLVTGAGVGTREREFRNSRPRKPIDRERVAATRSGIARRVKLALAPQTEAVLPYNLAPFLLLYPWPSNRERCSEPFKFSHEPRNSSGAVRLLSH